MTPRLFSTCCESATTTISASTAIRQYDALLDRARKEMDLTKRGQLLAQAESTTLKDNAWFPAFFWVEQNLVRPYVKGWEVNPVDYPPHALDQHRHRGAGEDVRQLGLLAPGHIPWFSFAPTTP